MKMPAFTQSPYFWEGAFIFALLLLIASHKISIEGLLK